MPKISKKKFKKSLVSFIKNRGFIINKNMISINLRDINMSLYGKNSKELFEIFDDEIDVLYRNYVIVNDKKLSPCSIKLKKWLLDIGRNH